MGNRRTTAAALGWRQGRGWDIEGALQNLAPKQRPLPEPNGKASLTDGRDALQFWQHRSEGSGGTWPDGSDLELSGEEMQVIKWKDLRGVIAAMVTPLSSDEEVDEAGLRRLTNYLIGNNVHGILTSGGTGEFPNMLGEEKRSITRVVVEEARGRVPVIAGTAACSTKETILLTRDAKASGADAALITAPYYYTLPEEALYHHYEEIAAASSLPIVIYNNPEYTGNNLSPRLIARLARLEGIIGLKQTNADLAQTMEVNRLVGSDFAVLTGIDSQFYPALCVGAVGIISTAANVVPRQMADLYTAFVEGRHQEALDLQMRLQAWNRWLEGDLGYVSPCKEALALLGLPGGAVRRPQPELTGEERAGISQALAELGLLHRRPRGGL